jgi:hypothetical protein
VLVAGLISVVGIAVLVWRMLHTSDPLVPPSLFRSREFTVMNLATVLLYGAIGVSFFLVVRASGCSGVVRSAGIARSPRQFLMLIFSSASGSLAQRIGPLLQLTVWTAHRGRRVAAPHASFRHVVDDRRVAGCGAVRARSRDVRRR